MLKKQKFTYRVLKRHVKDTVKKLLATNHTIQDIFNISFSRKEFVILNTVKYNKLTAITYGEAYKEIKRFANHFKKNIDKNEKYVGLLLENKPEWIYSFYALLMAGFIPVCLSTRAKEEAIINILDRLGSKTVVSDFNLKSKINKINPHEILERNPLENETWENAVIFTTSGTSGEEKIIRYTGEELTASISTAAGNLRDYPIIAASDHGVIKLLLVLPLYHVFGFIAVYLWYTFFFGILVIPSSMASNKIREAALIARPSHLFAVPLFWDTVANSVEKAVAAKGAEKKFEKALKLSLFIQKNAPYKGPKFVREKLFASYLDNIFGTTIAFCITGGSQISEKTLRIMNGLGYSLHNGFGSTEVAITSFADCRSLKARLSTNVGKPFDVFEYKIGEGNELLIRGASTYNAILIDGKFVENNHKDWIHTADSAEIVDGNYFVRGRMDEIFVGNNGENYSLPIIEKDFKANFATDVVAIPVREKELGLVVVFDEKCSDYQIKSDLSSIINSEAFKNHDIKEVYIVHHEIEKANGMKIKRNLIKKEFKNFDKVKIEDYLDKEFKFEVNEEILNIIKDKFRNALGKDEVNDNSDFFTDLGGDSMSYYEMIESLESEFNIELTLNDGFKRTPVQFAILIETKCR